jgi:hypothetical protein
VHHLLNRFLRSLQFEQRAAILKRTDTWPSSLRMAFQAATIEPDSRHHSVRRLSTIVGRRPEGIPLVTYNEFTL